MAIPKVIYLDPASNVPPSTASPGTLGRALRLNMGLSQSVYQRGSNLYVSGYLIVEPESIQAWIGVAKSTDGGATWAMMDTAHPIQTKYFDDYWVSGDVIYFCYMDSNVNLRLASFDMSTDLFTVISTTGPTFGVINANLNIYEWTIGITPLLFIGLERLSFGTLVAMYAHFEPVHGIWEVRVTTFSAGVWAASQLVSHVTTTDNDFPYRIGLTSNDIAYMLWQNGTDGKLWSTPFAAGVLGTPAIADGIAPIIDANIPTTVMATKGVYLPLHDVLVFNYFVETGFNAARAKLLIIGAASTITPTYTVRDTGQNTTRVQAFLAASDESIFYVYFAIQTVNMDGTWNIQLRRTTSTDFITWTASTLIWDNTIDPENPLAGSDTQPTLAAILPKFLSMGQISLVLGLEYQDNTVSGLYYTFPFTSPGTINLTFNLKGAAPPAGLELVSVQPPPPGPPGPVVNPTECVNQE